MNIELQNPCSENWDAMQTCKSGKFCSVCSHNVQDFTQSSDLEIVNAMSSREKICGRFSENQLNRNLEFGFINSLLSKFAVGFFLTTAGFISAQQGQDSKEILLVRKLDGIGSLKTPNSPTRVVLGMPSSKSYQNGREPLYILDGKIMDAKDFRKIDPNTIKSMRVLKDKNATDLYGEKGKNGVIVIESKGKSKKPKKKKPEKPSRDMFDGEPIIAV